MSKKVNKKCLREDLGNEEIVDQCLVCREDDPIVLEEHHICGRNNSDLVTTLCKSCHMPITHELNKVPRESRSKNASYPEKIACQLINIGALLREIGEQLIELGHELIKYVQNSSSGLHSKA